MAAKTVKAMSVPQNNFNSDRTYKARIEFSTKREALEIPNLSHQQWLAIKENIWVRGVAFFHDVNTCEVVSPLQIKSVFVITQEFIQPLE